jgi:hypothetical protein
MEGYLNFYFWLVLYFCISLIKTDTYSVQDNIIKAENIDDLEILQNKIKEKSTIVVFHADWCGHW